MSPIPMAQDDMKKEQQQQDSALSPEIMNAIYGNVEDKKKAYEESLKRYV